MKAKFFAYATAAFGVAAIAALSVKRCMRMYGRARADRNESNVEVLKSLVSQLLLQNKALGKLYRSGTQKLKLQEETIRRLRIERWGNMHSVDQDKKIRQQLKGGTNGVVVAALNINVPCFDAFEKMVKNDEAKKNPSQLESVEHWKLETDSSCMESESSHVESSKVENGPIFCFDESAANEFSHENWVDRRFVSCLKLLPPRTASMLVLREVAERAVTDDAFILQSLIRAAEDCIEGIYTDHIESKLTDHLEALYADNIEDIYSATSCGLLFHRTSADRLANQNNEFIPPSTILRTMLGNYDGKLHFQQFRDEFIAKCTSILDECRVRCV